MKRTTRMAALLLALTLLTGQTAFASGEASDSFNTANSTSGEAENTAIFTVDGATVTERAGGYSLVGEIGPTEAKDIVLYIGGFTDSGILVADGDYTIEDSVIVHGVSPVAGATDAGGWCAGVTGGLLTVKNSTLIANGKGGVFGNYTIYCAENGTEVPAFTLAGSEEDEIIRGSLAVYLQTLAQSK